MKHTLSIIQEFFKDKDEVMSVIAYGTFIETGMESDLDICVILNKKNSLSAADFKSLSAYRNALIGLTGKDIDLVPHSLDELAPNSLTPLTYPWHNPSLALGRILKGTISIPQCVTMKDLIFTHSDTAKYHLLLDRTLIRRAACREGTDRDNDIILNKIRRLPYNIINYLSITSGHEYMNLDPDNYIGNLSIIKDVCKLKSTSLSFGFNQAVSLNDKVFKQLGPIEQKQLIIMAGEFMDQLLEIIMSQEISQIRFLNHNNPSSRTRR
jgi:hypothetical protein